MPRDMGKVNPSKIIKYCLGGADSGRVFRCFEARFLILRKGLDAASLIYILEIAFY